METLKTLIGNLAFILLLATFLEMLLPNHSLRGFVRLVMGIFVIAAVLQPLAGLLKLPTEDFFQAWTQSAAQTPAVVPEGQSDAPGKMAVREQYRKILQSQIKTVAESFGSVVSSDVQIELGSEGDGYLDYPPIRKISVVLYKSVVSVESADSVEKVETIVVGEETGTEKEKEKAESDLAAEGDNKAPGTERGKDGAMTFLERQVRDKVAEALQVERDIVEVHEK